jgi:hypothetical protein
MVRISVEVIVNGLLASKPKQIIGVGFGEDLIVTREKYYVLFNDTY